MNLAREVLKNAELSGYTFRVCCDGNVEYNGPKASMALKAITVITEGAIVVFLENGKRIGWMVARDYLALQETVIDYSAHGKISELIDAVINQG